MIFNIQKLIIVINSLHTGSYLVKSAGVNDQGDPILDFEMAIGTIIIQGQRFEELEVIRLNM